MAPRTRPFGRGSDPPAGERARPLPAGERRQPRQTRVLPNELRRRHAGERGSNATRSMQRAESAHKNILRF
jgi:hypothetical protein